MKKILFVTARFPWPIITGDALRAYNQIKELAEEHIVDVFSVEKTSVAEGDINSIINTRVSGNITKAGKIKNILLNGGRTALQCAMYNDRKSWQKLQKLLAADDYDVVIFQLVRLEYLILKTISFRDKRNLKAKIYCDYVDALSLNMMNRAATESFFMKKVCRFESKKISWVEERIYQAVDGKFIISERDAKYIGKNGFDIIPNGVAIPKVDIRPDKDSKTINLAFWGNMSYYPNVKAALFLAELLSALPDKKYLLHIVGAQPSKHVQALKSVNGIVVHGFVDDLTKLLGNMDLAVFPIFDGSGLQNKVLEAFALGLPVITTDIVLDSMPKLREYAISANSKIDFVNSIKAFEPRKEQADEQSHNAIEVLRKYYNWNIINNVIGTK